MAKGSNQKLKLYYLLKFLQEKTDEEHAVTMPEILAYLQEHDISAERKSIYADFHDLEKLGYEVVGEKAGASYEYRLLTREFELTELKLLVDLIQTSKFLTLKKSQELISKLESQCSEYDAKKLQRQVYVQDRVKADNESIYYSVDAIQSAIAQNHMISFQYFQWNTGKKRELRRGGEPYEVSPWMLSFNDENYYLIARDEKSRTIRHYRVDKMLNITMLDREREGKEAFEQENIATYSNKKFGMFGGEEEKVKILFPNHLAGVFIDRFGKDIMIVPKGKDYSTVSVSVTVSQQFFGWIFGLGKEVCILSPPHVVAQMKQALTDALEG
ncbi:MAG: WYL domain-containing protein [Lachnospiraceae bacterium]|nr:WYL domain-containing protein [Lachnospiraceae bacterium]MDD5853292.1 WYL domain-containing protein [Lachnospiraceae bacterium]